MLTLKEIRQLGIQEVIEEIEKVNREWKSLKLDILNGTSKETHRLKLLKKQRAQLRTVITESRKDKNSVVDLKEVKKVSKKPKVKSE